MQLVCKFAHTRYPLTHQINLHVRGYIFKTPAQYLNRTLNVLRKIYASPQIASEADAPIREAPASIMTRASWDV